MATRATVLVIDKDPRAMRALLGRGEPESVPFKLLILQFNLHFPSLIAQAIAVNPDVVVLGSGFGRLPYIGENFVVEFDKAGFSGKYVVCCSDTYKVLPHVEVERIQPVEGLARKALFELLS